MKSIRFLKRYLKGNYLRAIGMVIFALVAVSLNLISPLILSYFIDYVIDQQPITSPITQKVFDFLGGVPYLRTHLWVGALLIIGVYTLLAITLFLRQYLSGKMSENIVYRLRNDLFRHIQRLPYSYFGKKKTGELIQRCTSDVDQIRRFTGNQLQQLIRSITLVLFALTILSRIHQGLTLRAVILMPILLFYAYFFFKKNQKVFREMDESEERFTAMAQENLAGIRVVKAFGREKYEVDRFEKHNQELRGNVFRMMKLLSMYWSTSDVISMCQMLIVLFSGISLCRNGELSIGSFFLFVNYEGNMLWPLRQLGRILADFGKCGVSIQRLEEILEEKEEDLESGKEPVLHGAIQFDHVSFRYPDGKDDVLDNVSFEVKPGETIAIIGPTGSGKSSLVHLLTSLYDYQKGSIKLDGVELREINKKYLRKHVGIVLQEPFLFSKSIYENIHLSNPSSTKEDVEKAAETAAIHSVIESFDAGYDTLVGEKGVTLSGGQKQRIAIARTVLNDNQILIFDDSLSAVDSETDAQIRKALQTLQQGVTTIIITQRVNSAKDADCIFVLENGKITQQGSHEELVNEDGLYARVNHIQSSYILEERHDNETI
ncbi:MAG: ABC transporter ATP-binding protein [Solobacterium sp.]|nr:ABC transporter ATP-binding protein [Solobacterium sp.]